VESDLCEQDERAAFDVALALVPRRLEDRVHLFAQRRHVGEPPRGVGREIPSVQRRLELGCTQHEPPGAHESAATERAPARFLERLARLVAELLGHRPVELAEQLRRLVEMVRTDLDELVVRALAHPARERLMLLGPLRLAHPRVGDVADEYVLEAECAVTGDRRAFLRHDELPLEEEVEHRADVEIGRQMVERATPEDAADQRSALQQPLDVGIEPVDSGSDQGLDAVRDPLEDVVVHQHPRDLLEEQWIALGALEHHRPLRRRHVTVHQRRRQLVALERAERGELDRAGPRAASAPRGPNLEQLGAGDRDDQHGRGPQRPREMLDQVEQRFFRPVHVLEDEDQRLHVGELLGPLQRGPRQLLRCPLALRGAQHAERDGEEVGDGLALAAHAQLLEGAVRRVVVRDAGARLDHRGERPVSHALAVRQRPAGEDRRALDALDELGDEARLAEPGLAVDGDELRAPVAHRSRECVLEELELRLAPDERRLHRAPGGVEHPKRAPCPQRLAAAADLDRTGVLDLDGAGREPARARAEPDLARRRHLLEARGEVHRLAGRERLIRVLDHDLARFDADPRLELELVDGLHDGEGRANRPFGVVLVGERDAERRHHGIAGELLDGPAEALDALGDPFEVPRHAAADDLGILGRDELRRVDEIDEENGGKLPLHNSSVGSGTASTTAPLG
jgi:hypothetical protein